MVDNMQPEDDAAVEEILDAVNMQPNEAMVEVTIGGQQGTLPDPVPWDATPEDLKGWVAEAVRAGGIQGLDPVPDADFTDYVVDRFDAKDNLPNRFALRPKTEYGA